MTKTKPARCPITEFAVAGIGFGVMNLLLAYGSFTIASRAAPPLLGFPRHLVLGVPPALLGLGFVASGVWLKASKNPWAVNAIIGCSFILLLADLAIELGVMGRYFAFGVFSLVIYALPFILLSRARRVRERIVELRALARSASAE